MSSASPRTTSALRSDPAQLDPVFAALRRRVAAGELPSAALAIGDAQGGIRTEVFDGGNAKVVPESYFFLASLTKPIFATAFMQLVESGGVDLHAPIVAWLPEFGVGSATDRKARVSAFHLLTHTSGVADVDSELIRRKRPSAAAMTRMVLDAPLRFAPGERWEYCSASFYLLARIIERVSGQPYPEYLRDHLLAPLGMEATFDPRGSGRPIVAVRGVGADNRLTQFLIMRYLAGAAVPGGGLFGTLDDLLRFGAATLRPRHEDGRVLPLSAASIALMGADHVRGLRGEFEGEQRQVHFGLGWGKPTLMGDLPGSTRVISHGGASGTRLWIDPEIELVLVFLTNQWSAGRGTEIEAIASVYESLAGQG